MIFPGDEWKGAQAGSYKLHWVKWDPRSAWRRAFEFPLRKFYVIKYDPFVWVPEEELVWDTHEQQASKDARDSWIVLCLLFLFFGGTIMCLWIMSIFFK